MQNSLGFMPEVKPLHRPRGDLLLCAHMGFYNFLSTCLNCSWHRYPNWRNHDFLNLSDFKMAPKKSKGAKEKERELAREFRDKGKKNKKIAQQIGKSIRWVCKWCNCDYDTNRQEKMRKGNNNSKIIGQRLFRLWLTTKGITILVKMLKML